VYSFGLRQSSQGNRCWRLRYRSKPRVNMTFKKTNQGWASLSYTSLKHIALNSILATQHLPPFARLAYYRVTSWRLLLSISRTSQITSFSMIGDTHLVRHRNISFRKYLFSWQLQFLNYTGTWSCTMDVAVHSHQSFQWSFDATVAPSSKFACSIDEYGHIYKI
jgi:hypothetical protein